MTLDLIKEGPIVLKLLLALLFGGFIGYDRERDGKDAGIRTYAAVCLGACLFTDLGLDFKDKDATSRIIAYIISGIGFLGGGIIFKDAGKGAQGLTTAATIWCTAGVGVAIGLEFFITAAVSTLAIYFLLALPKWRWYRNIKLHARSRKDQED